MADEGAPSGWASQIVLLYETFLLRDLLGYAFPGAVLLLGVDRLSFSQRPVLDVISDLERSWLLVALALAAAYAAGVFLRLAGTWTHALVIAPVVGWCGDPWALKAAATHNERSWWERPWRSRYEAAVEAWYRRAYAAGPGGAARVSDREDIFLHLAASLGFALLIVGLVSVLGMRGVGGICPLSGSWTVALLAAAVVFIAGHYRHARTIYLLNRATGKTV
jgi:hypothetical protein